LIEVSLLPFASNSNNGASWIIIDERSVECVNEAVTGDSSGFSLFGLW
jgi:hypothetical protein